MPDRAALRYWALVLSLVAALTPAGVDKLNATAGYVQAAGTLVFMIPTADGLVVAADSRLTIASEPRRYCDNGFKLVIDEQQRAVATVTGISAVYALPSALPESCAEIARMTRIMDIYRIVRAFLSEHGVDGSLELLQDLCLAEVRKAQSIDTDTFSDFRGRDYFTVALGRFDPGSETSSVAGFVVALDDNLHPFVKQGIRDTASPADRMTCWIFGQGEYVDNEIFNGPGAAFLGERSRNFLTPAQRIAQVSGAETLDFINDTFHAVEIIAPTNPPKWGIGGPIDILRLHKHGLDIIRIKLGPGVDQARAVNR